MHLDYTDFSPYPCSFSLDSRILLACVALRCLYVSAYVITCTFSSLGLRGPKDSSTECAPYVSTSTCYSFSFCWPAFRAFSIVLYLYLLGLRLTYCLYSASLHTRPAEQDFTISFHFYTEVRTGLRFPVPPLRSDSYVPPTVFFQPPLALYIHSACISLPRLRAYSPALPPAHPAFLRVLRSLAYSAALLDLFCRY